MKIHLEHKWWTIADIKPSSEITCPHCGKTNSIEGIESHASAVNITAPNPEAFKQTVAQIEDRTLEAKNRKPPETPPPKKLRKMHFGA